MVKTDIKIENFKKELGTIYPLVERIWKEICEKGFSIEPHEELRSKEHPVAECTDLEKILLTCITYIEYDTQGQVTLTKSLLLTRSLLLLVCKNHKVAQGAKIEIRKSFLIVIAN
jgi:hypothetical protein